MTDDTIPDDTIPDANGATVDDMEEDANDQTPEATTARDEPTADEPHVVRIIPFEKYESTPFIRSSDRLLQVLRSLHRNEEAMLFENRHGDVKYMLRSTSETTDEMMSFDIVVPHDPDEDKGEFMKRLLTDEYACVEDEGGDFVFDTCLVAHDAGKEDLDEIRDMLNWYYNLEICECHANLVKTDDAGGVCFRCALQSDDRDSTGSACIICADEIKTARGLVTMHCCKQTMHRKCFNLWKQDKTTNCPVCRQ